jgi:hypothetical protein
MWYELACVPLGAQHLELNIHLEGCNICNSSETYHRPGLAPSVAQAGCFWFLAYSLGPFVFHLFFPMFEE